MDGWTSDIYKERETKGARWIDPIKELELYMEAKCKLTSCWIRDVMVQKWLHRGREKRAIYIYIYIYILTLTHILNRVGGITVPPHTFHCGLQQ
jgi:hypothetical protein